MSALAERLSSNAVAECAGGLRAIAAGDLEAPPDIVAIVERLVADERSIGDGSDYPTYLPIATLALDALAALGKIDAIAAAARAPRIVDVPWPTYDQGIYIGNIGTRPFDLQAHAAALLAKLEDEETLLDQLKRLGRRFFR